MRYSILFVNLLIALVCPAHAAAQTVPLQPGTVVQFATADQARDVLQRDDDFLNSLSRFDRQLRMRTQQPVSQEDLKQLIGDQARSWTEQEIERLTPIIESLSRRIKDLELPLPETVLLIKTSGREESGLAYCRHHAVVLPINRLNDGDNELERLLAHELFHILSRQNPELQEQLYELIGFRCGRKIALPESLRSRKITNPDAPSLNCTIQIEVDGERRPALPLLLADADYAPDRGNHLFDYLQFHLLVLEEDGGQLRVRTVDDKPQLIRPTPQSAPSYFDQIGRNTRYIIHPEEVLADNFTLMLFNDDVPNPALIEQIKTTLKQSTKR